MADIVIRVGCCSAQGLRANNEDRFVVDAERQVYVVADGMGGHELGERASGLAVEILPQAVVNHLASRCDPGRAVQRALADANKAIIDAGKCQPAGRRMGTTAVLAVQLDGQIYVAGLGDSRAYLVRAGRADQLTVDHSVATALVVNGTLTPEQARHSPWQHVLYKFLGCTEMAEGADVRPFSPEAGDRLLLATDGLTNHVSEEDLCQSSRQLSDPQACADHLVQLALQRGSKDNVTCVVVAFEQE